MKNIGTIAEQAEGWFVHLDAGDASDRELNQFKVWLDASPAHADAYGNLMALSQSAGSLKRLAQLEMPSKQTDIHHESPAVSLGWRIAGMRQLFTTVYNAGVGLKVIGLTTVSAGLALAVVWFTSVSLTTQHYSTETSQTTLVALEDGSSVNIGASSQISVSYSDNKRLVKLTGEAYFSVAPDADRPFYVDLGDTVVRVVGTKFNVRSNSQTITVGVEEGNVEVRKPGTSLIDQILSIDKDVEYLSRGQQVTSLREGDLADVKTVDADSVASWRLGLLSYEDTPLSTVIADANRYYDAPIKIMSEKLGRQTVTMSFATNQIDEMIESLTVLFPVVLQTGQAGEILINFR